MSGVLGVDVGGTFTDFVRWDGAALTTGKEPSTAHDQSVGVMAGATSLGGVERFLHGTTVATNALLEGKGARTALVTSPGFADVVEIGRQDRPSLYDSFADRSHSLVPRELRFEAAPADGWVPPAAIGAAEAVVVSLLYGFRRGDDEERLATAVRTAVGPGVPISLSSTVAPEFREYERTITTALNAYLAPETGSYLRRLVERARANGLPEDILVMRSSGGLMPVGEAARLPASILLSGPAGGVMAAAALGELTGRSTLVSFDMGGTSTDVCRIENGRPDVSYERNIAGYPCRMPSVAVHTVGAGGGSVAWRDPGGALRVGPRSAGADPGPAAYGRGGGEPTVTDANVVLGRIAASTRLAGNLAIRPDLAGDAVSGLGAAFGLDGGETALGITKVVEEVMAGAIRKVSLEEGVDPRDATLVAFGGAGGLHATALARRLDMAGVLVPLHAGVFSALGLLVSPPRVDVAQSVHVGVERAATLDALLAEVADAARRRLIDDVGIDPDAVDVRIDARYVGQSHELSVPYDIGAGWDVLASDFHALHHVRNGFARPGDAIEVMTLRAEATGRAALRFADVPVPGPVGPAVTGRRAVVTDRGVVEATVVSRSGLAPGHEVTGPAVIEEREATTFIAEGERARVLTSGAVEVEW